MNATELFHKDGKPAGLFYCEKCRMMAQNRETAEQCCQNYKCSVCGRDTGERHWLICEECRRADDARKEREHFEKAEKLHSCDGPVWHGDEFYQDLETMLDMLDGDPLPKYVWASNENHFVHACVEDITGCMEGDAYEDWDPETLNGLDELKVALDKFNEANKEVVSYTPDYTKAVMVEKG